MWHGALLGQLQQLQFIIPEAFNQQLLVLLGFWATKCHKTVSQHLQTSQHLSTIGSDGFTEGRTDREWQRVEMFPPKPKKAHGVAKSPCLEKKLNATWSSDQLMSPPKTWFAMARYGSLLLCLEAIGSHCVIDVPCTSGASNSFRISFSSSSGREQNAQNGV